MASCFFLNRYLLLKMLNKEVFISFNPIALRKAKTVYRFGLSECNKVELILIENGSKNENARVPFPEIYPFT